jgi:acyl carrier protein
MAGVIGSHLWRSLLTFLEELNDVFRQVFADESLEITPEMTAKDVYGWDSLSNINLLLAIELRFCVKITPVAQQRFHNIGDMASYIEEQKK